MSRTRRSRTPFSANRKRLQVAWKEPDKQKNFISRWFNDQDDRIMRAEQAGYEYVSPDEIDGVGDKEVHGGNTDLGSKVSRVVGRTNENQPIRAYLMKIRKDWYEEDQAEKEKINARTDESMRVGKAGGASVQNAYFPLTEES